MAGVVDAAALMVACGVHLVVVGGAALWMHGDRSTPVKDLDVVPAPDAANIDRLLGCRRVLGATPRTWPTAAQLARCELVTVRTSFGSIDVLGQRGREEYETLRADATLIALRREAIPVASRVDVHRLKRRFEERAGV